MSIKREILVDAIEKAAKKHGLPPQGRASLYAIAKIESGFGRNLVGQVIDASGAAEQHGQRAIGPFQFMPSTARAYGIKNAMDPYESADGAAAMLKDSYAKQGDWYRAAIGHHSGGAWKTLGKHGRDYASKLAQEIPRAMKQDLPAGDSFTMPRDEDDFSDLFDTMPTYSYQGKPTFSDMDAEDDFSDLFDKLPTYSYQAAPAAEEAELEPLAVDQPSSQQAPQQEPQQSGVAQQTGRLPLQAQAQALLDATQIPAMGAAAVGGFADVSKGFLEFAGQGGGNTLGNFGVPGFTPGKQDNMLTRAAEALGPLEAGGKAAAQEGFFPAVARELPRFLGGGPIRQGLQQGAISFLENDDMLPEERLLSSGKDALAAFGISSAFGLGRRLVAGPTGHSRARSFMDFAREGDAVRPNQAAANIGSMQTPGAASESLPRVLMETGRRASGELSGPLRKTFDRQMDDVARASVEAIGGSTDDVWRNTNLRPYATAAKAAAKTAIKEIAEQQTEIHNQLALAKEMGVPPPKDMLTSLDDLAVKARAAADKLADANTFNRSLDARGVLDPAKLHKGVVNNINAGVETAFKPVAEFLESPGVLPEIHETAIRQFPRMGIASRVVSALANFSHYPSEAMSYYMAKVGAPRGAAGVFVEKVLPEAIGGGGKNVEAWSKAFDFAFNRTRDATIAGRQADQYVERNRGKGADSF